MKAGTLKEEGEGREEPINRILFSVLSYDELHRDVFRAIPLDGPLAIGRADEPSSAGLYEGSLRVFDRRISGNHSRIELRGELAVITDLGSTNGTFVNEAKIDRHVLADGDRIEIGHTFFVYREIASPFESPVRFGPTRTASPELIELMRRLERIAPTDQPVLLLAPSGAGKEVAASEIHRLSGRPGALIAVDCGAIPETLFESTIFGHAKGAFTGAEPRIGELTRAERGTFFLDEVGNLSHANQAKLLRAIESRVITPLGASDPIPLDVRFVAATNRDIDADDFRADLLHRLAGFTARIPPLAERREDFGFLTQHFIKEIGLERASITVEAARLLFGGALPGNVRQLRSILRSACALSGGAIESEHLEPAALEPKRSSSPSIKQAKRSPSREEVEGALRETGGNVTRTAERFGVHARQIYRWIEQHGIALEALRKK